MRQNAGFFLKNDKSNTIKKNKKRQEELCANCLSCFKKVKRTKKRKKENYPEHVLNLNRDGFLSIFLWMLMIILNITDNNTDIMYCIYQLFLFIPCHLIQ